MTDPHDINYEDHCGKAMMEIDGDNLIVHNDCKTCGETKVTIHALHLHPMIRMLKLAVKNMGIPDTTNIHSEEVHGNSREEIKAKGMALYKSITPDAARAKVKESKDHEDPWG